MPPTSSNKSNAEATVYVSMSYWIDGDSNPDQDEPTLHKTFSSQDTAVARMGLPVGVEPTKPQAGSYEYSGMHDHGPLIPPREGGDMAQLIGCVQAAKKFSDDYLTQVIQGEKKQPKKTEKSI